MMKEYEEFHILTTRTGNESYVDNYMIVSVRARYVRMLLTTNRVYRDMAIFYVHEKTPLI